MTAHEDLCLHAQVTIDLLVTGVIRLLNSFRQGFH